MPRLLIKRNYNIFFFNPTGNAHFLLFREYIKQEGTTIMVPVRYAKLFRKLKLVLFHSVNTERGRKWVDIIALSKDIKRYQNSCKLNLRVKTKKCKY